MIVEVIEILAARSTRKRSGMDNYSRVSHMKFRQGLPWLGGVRGAQGVLGKQAEVISQRGR